MACNTCGKGSAKQSSVAQSLEKSSVEKTEYIRARASLCAVCQANNSGVCIEQKKITPEKDCVIQIGIPMKNAKCPIDMWGVHEDSRYDGKVECKRCKRIHGGFAEICMVCVRDLERKRRNANKGIGKIRRSFVIGSRDNGAAHLDNQMWNAVKNNPSRGRGHSAFTALASSTKFLTLSDLANDAARLASLIPPDVQGIVGVARSGMTPANIVSTMLHLPVMALRQTKNDIVPVGNGWRMGGSEHVGIGSDAKVCVVDDTCMTGNSFRAITPLLERTFSNFMTSALYVNPLAKKKPDIWVHDLEWPHVLEWNLWNSVLSPNCATDFDGVLCHDCQPFQDDDGDNYINFINNAIPKYLTRKVSIPLIVTARIEKYREQTVNWLHRHGVSFNRLVMHPAKSLRERQRDDIAAFKAKHFGLWAKHHVPRPAPLMFIESEDRQAKRIASITGRMVLCPSSAAIYGDPRR